MLLLILPGIAHAAEEDHLKIIPAAHKAAVDDMKNPDEIDNITTPHQSIRVDNSNETVTLSPRNGVDVTKPTKISAGAQMIKAGLENTIIDNINALFVSVGGMQLGDVEGKDRTQTAIFAVTAHTIDPTKDPKMMSRINMMRDIYIRAILIFGAALAIFLIYQSVCPEDSAEFLSDFNGRKYIAPAEMGSYFVKTCAWLLFGPALFFGSLITNNALVEDQMLSTLDQVTLSSDSLGLYLTFCILWICSILFFSIRLIMILISAHVWIMYGLPFAFKKTRWAAILVTAAVIVMIFSQFAIVWVCCTVVDYTTSQTLAWYSVSFIYLGLFATVVMMEFLFLTWPVLWKALSPKTLNTAIRIARYF